MNKVMINALSIGIAAALAVGISGCNRDADAGTSNGTAMSADATGDSNATSDAAVQYAKVVSVEPYIENGDLQGFFVTYQKP